MMALPDLVDTVNRKIGEWGSVVYLFVFAITIYDIVLRYLFNQPTIWGLELVIALAGIQYVTAGAHAIATDGHVRIDVIYNVLPQSLKRILRVVANVIVSGFVLVVMIYGIKQAYPSVINGETSGAGWNSHAPMWMKIAIPVGAALMLLQALVELVRSIRAIPNEQ